MPPSAEATGLFGAISDQLGGTDSALRWRAPPIAADVPDPTPPRPGEPTDPSAPGLNRFNSPDAPAAPFAAFMPPKRDAVIRMNCGLNGPPASAPLVTAVLKKLPFRKVPRAELFEPFSSDAKFDPEPEFSRVSSSLSKPPAPLDAEDVESVVEVSPLSNEVSPDEVEALVAAEVLVAWAAAAACPVSPAALVVCGAAVNGVNCEAAAEEPA